MIAQVLGGVGLFLTGMVLVTDGLRAAAGEHLRRVLLRFTGGHLKALVTGAAATAVVQSSSAITVAVIGFVGAGLLTFEQSLGVVFGANLGTTATGWLVALVGLKFSVSAVALPMVGVGALVRLFAKGRWGYAGMAVAGFGILFVGLDVLQEGMAGAKSLLTPDTFPEDTWGGRALLVGMGLLLTAVMQSSSAAVATVLTALHAGGLTLEQAAAVVVGANIGTTVTAGLAAIGASLAAKRTAVGHLVFNLVTGLVAFALLDPLVWLIHLVDGRLAPSDATLALAAFHTAFNLLGVLLLAPFLAPFARLVRRLVRERSTSLTRYLDPRATALGALAIEAVRRTVIEIAGVAAGAVRDLLLAGHADRGTTAGLWTASVALDETRAYLARLRVLEQMSEAAHHRHLSTVHALDHAQRLVEEATRAGTTGLDSAPAVVDLAEALADGLDAFVSWAGDPEQPAPAELVTGLAREARGRRDALRRDALEEVAAGRLDPSEAASRLETLRRLDLLAEHAEGLVRHLRGERVQEPAPVSASEDAATAE